jgi:hypothetical protein
MTELRSADLGEKMSESKHAKGPWTVGAEFDGEHGQFSILDGDGSECATVTAWIGKHRPEAEANARLVAAAPELLASLILLRDADDMGKPDGHNFMGPELRAATDAAIAKAEGRTP